MPWITTKNGKHINTDWFDEKGNDKHYNDDGSYKWVEKNGKWTAGRGNNAVSITYSKERHYVDDTFNGHSDRRWDGTYEDKYTVNQGTRFAFAKSLEEAKKLAEQKFPPNKQNAVYTGPSPSKSTKEKQIEANKKEADRKNADEKQKSEDKTWVKNDKGDSYHVDHTGSAGEKYVDKGKVGEYSIGQKVQWKYSSIDKDTRTVTINKAIIRPNGSIDYNVKDENGKGHLASRDWLKKYNK